MTLRITIFAVIMSASYSSALAQIGESLDECKAKYGEAREGRKINSAQTYAFEKNGLRVVAVIFNGRVSSIAFFRSDSDSSGKALPLSEQQIKTLLSENDGGSAWIEQPKNNGERTWQTRDKTIRATYDPQDNRLIVTVPADAYMIQEG